MSGIWMLGSRLASASGCDRSPNPGWPEQRAPTANIAFAQRAFRSKEVGLFIKLLVSPKRLAATGLILGMASCSSIFGPEEPEVSIGLYSEMGYGRVGLFEVDIGGRLFRFEPTAGVSRKVNAPETGLLPVRIRLLSTVPDTLASAEFSQLFREGSNHWVVGRLGLQRPIGHCIGHLLVLPLPKEAGESEPDTLFLTYGSIPEGAVC